MKKHVIMRVPEVGTPDRELSVYEDVIIAVDMFRGSYVISGLDDMSDFFDGSCCVDNNFVNLPIEPGIYCCVVEFDFLMGFFEGYRAPGESDWEFRIIECRKFDESHERIHLAFNDLIKSEIARDLAKQWYEMMEVDIETVRKILTVRKLINADK